jgi:hypothetical protein
MARAQREATFTASAILRDSGGTLVDCADLTLTISDPSGVLAGFPVSIPPIVHVGQGEYSYAWAVPAGAALAVHELDWAGTGDVDGLAYSGSESVLVVEAGTVTTGLLTVEELLLRPGMEAAASLEESVLQSMLDAAEDAIIGAAGPFGPMSEVLDGGGSYLFLRRRAKSIESITETVWNDETVLDLTDYRLRPDGVSVVRLRTGTNPPLFWGGQGFYGPEFGVATGFLGSTITSQSTCPWGHKVTVSYTPLDDFADRCRVQVALIKIDLAYAPGVIEEQVGAWLVRRDRGSATWNDSAEREAILASLQPQAYAPGFA